MDLVEKADSKVILPKEPTDEDPYRHLPAREAAILKGQVFTPDAKVGIATLYRYASRNDLIIMAVSTLAAIASGAALPLMTIIFGNLQGTFQGYFQQEISYDNFLGELTTLVLYFVYLAIGEFVTTYIATVGFIYTGEHVSAKIREHYLESCMKQNIGFFDKLGAGEVTTRITSDTNLIQDGISEKVGLTIAAVASTYSALDLPNSVHFLLRFRRQLANLYRSFCHRLYHCFHQLLEAGADFAEHCRCPDALHGRWLNLHCEVFEAERQRVCRGWIYC